MEAKIQSKAAKITLKSSLKRAAPEQLPNVKSLKRTRMQFEAENKEKETKPSKKLKPVEKPKQNQQKPMKTRSKSAKEKSLKPLSEVPKNKAVKFVNEKTKLAPDKF
jgi:hypothetical protein